MKLRRFLFWPGDHPVPVLVFLTAISLLAATQISHIEIHVSPQGLTMEKDPAREFYERSVATFGSDNTTIIFIRDSALFTPEKLTAIQALVARLEALPFVEYTRSLISVPHLRVKDEYVKTDPYLAVIPTSVTTANEILTTALENPFVRRNLLSEDGTAMAINVTITEAFRAPGDDSQIAADIDQSIVPLRSVVDNVFQIGLPLIRTKLNNQITGDQRTIFPLAMVALLVTLGIGLRRLNGALLPFLTSSLSVLWTLALMAALSIPLNVMTAIVPILLIIIGSTEDVHLIAEYYGGTRRGLDRRLAVRFMVRRVGMTVLLTFLTSCLGFLSVASSPVILLREFGLVAATGLAINILITLLLVPAHLSVFGDRQKSNRKATGAFTAPDLLSPLVGLALSHRKLTMALTLAVAGVAVAFSFSIRVNNNVLDYFDEDTVVRQRVNEVHNHLSGIETFSVIVDGRIDGTFLKVRYLEDLRALQQFITSHPAFDFAVSFSDYLAMLNSVANETGDFSLPDDDDVVNELMLFVKHDKVKEYASPDFSRASILVRHSVGSSYELRQALNDIYMFARNNIDQDLEVQITGESILTNNAADHMASSQAKSLAIMLLVIFLVISLLFVNPRAGLLAILPNLFPIMILFGTMGFLGIQLDTGTAMIAAIAIGICIDHTMHFMVRYNRELREHTNETDAIKATVREEVTPISAVTVSLAAGFATLAFSSFTPVVSFGLLSALVMITAYFANFFITPLILSYTRLVTLWDLLSIEVRRDLKRDCLLFANMRSNQIKRVILLGRVKVFGPGEIVMKRGNPSSEIYIVLRGAVHLQRVDDNGDSAESFTLKSGSVFGIMALVSGRNRVATATTSEETQVLCLNWARIQQIAHFHPRTAALLFQNLSSIIGTRFIESISNAEPIVSKVSPVTLHSMETESRYQSLELDS